VYAIGFSNGAGFTYLLWAERPDLFAAFAMVAGRPDPSVRPAKPRPVAQIAGDHDERMPPAERQAAMMMAVAVNGIGGEAQRSCGQGCTIQGASSPVPVMTWVFPGAHEYLPEISSRVVTFFKQHSR
jgi:polyhydroxybutyrate depolymerase